MPNDDSILEDIRGAASLIRQFKGDLGPGDFAGDARAFSAVLFQLVLVAESVHRLSQAFKDRHPSINWFRLAALRDRLLHAGSSVDPAEIARLLDAEFAALAKLAEAGVARISGADSAQGAATARPSLANTGELIRNIRDQFLLEWEGEHGIYHFWAVRETGLWLAPRTGALPDVVEAFALLHDACRRDDYEDDYHSEAAAALAEKLKDLLGMDAAAFRLLKEAILKHHLGISTKDPTLGTCWDADHLDIGRIGGAVPDVAKLSTVAAKDKRVIEWAYKRSRGEKAEIPY